ncbi:MAG: carbohydrate kinase family protein [Firmicutes bacterium]|nr:carbohydrate kinase family protein [Bacillota bacterium]
MTQKVALVGNYNIDLIMGTVPEMPAWGTETLIETVLPRVAGGAGNTAQALGSLGVSALAVGAVGDDAYGQEIIKTLTGLNLDVSLLKQVKGSQTGIGFTILKEDGERSFLTYLGVLADYQDSDLLAALPKVQEADIVLFAGYNLLPALTTFGLEKFFAGVKKAGATLLFDTGWDVNDWRGDAIAKVERLLPYVDIFLPNLAEARAISQVAGDLPAIGRRLVDLGTKSVVIKLGPEGAAYYDRENEILAKGVKVKAVDTTGAGDSFNAGVIYGLLKEWSPDKYLDFANRLAAHVIQRLEERYPSLSQLLD